MFDGEGATSKNGEEQAQLLTCSRTENEARILYTIGKRLFFCSVKVGTFEIRIKYIVHRLHALHSHFAS